MTGTQLVQFRKQSKRTQVQSARSLGVSQTYLSLLEKGKRPLTDELRAKAVRVFRLSATELPTGFDLSAVPLVSDDQLATDLATLGYPGFGYLKKGKPKNPAVVLFSALNAADREARAVEALPWVVLTFADMDWLELLKAAKVNNLQNRLGFVTNVARRVAEHRRDNATSDKLMSLEAELENSLLFYEGTLCKTSMTNAERKWLKSRRPKMARHWRLLTNLEPRQLRYYDG